MRDELAIPTKKESIIQKYQKYTVQREFDFSEGTFYRYLLQQSQFALPLPDDSGLHVICVY